MTPANDCEDCGDEIPEGQRRTRCPHCKKLVCGWCFNHVHGLNESEMNENKPSPPEPRKDGE